MHPLYHLKSTFASEFFKWERMGGRGGVNWVNSYRSVENQCGEEYPLPPLLTCALYHLKQTIQQDVLVRSLCRIDLQIDTTSISLFCLLYNMLPLVY